jgi:hypothetical protein
MYLARWVDSRLIGLLSYHRPIPPRSSSLKPKWGMVIAFVVILYGFFSHNVLEDRTTLLLLAISTAAGAAWIEGAARPSS